MLIQRGLFISVCYQYTAFWFVGLFFEKNNQIMGLFHQLKVHVVLQFWRTAYLKS
jgi:hypothetical protein